MGDRLLEHPRSRQRGSVRGRPGHDTINTTASDPRAAYPCAPGETLFVHDEDEGVKTCDANGRIQIRGDWRETMSTHWFHDHMLDFTAQNVYKGNAAMANFYSAIDRGNEAHNDGVNLRLPSGTALPWGNRDYDVNLLIADKAWDQEGQLWYNIFNTDGFLGDRILTNWLYKPYFEVRRRRYRFRILNGSVSRYFRFALVKQLQGSGGQFPVPPGSGVSYDRIGFHMIANDGNIMEHAVPFDGTMDLDGDGNASEHEGILPTQGIAERYDIVVDFAAQGIQAGDKLYFVNVLEHTNGKVTGDKIPLAAILSEQYKPVVDGDRWINGDPGVGRFLEFRVVAYAGTDLSMDPNDFEPGGQTMIPLPIDRNDPQLNDALRREFIFGRSGGTDEAPWTIKTDGGAGLNMDPRRVSAARVACRPSGRWHLASGLPQQMDVEVLPVPHSTHPGLLMAIGGAEDKTRQRVILRYFLEAAGGEDSNVVVLATAADSPESGERYAELFYNLRADEVEVLRIEGREEALAGGQEAQDLLEYATGLFITGGSQLKLSSALGGTAIADTIRRRHREGMVVAGTSAGAALLSEHMIALGESGGTPRRRLVHMAQGLGLAPDLVIDQHFRRRDRLGRLLTALSYNPEPLGLGVDEDTAAIIEPGKTVSVLGAGAVVVVDASALRFTDSWAVHRGQPVAMMGLKVDFLTSGCRYDLDRRTGIAPPTAVRIGSVVEETPVAVQIADEAEVSADGGE